VVVYVDPNYLIDILLLLGMVTIVLFVGYMMWDSSRGWWKKFNNRRCDCGKYRLHSRREHRDDPATHHEINLCQPQRETIQR
jgi:hypothetical protein